MNAIRTQSSRGAARLVEALSKIRKTNVLLTSNPAYRSVVLVDLAIGTYVAVRFSLVPL